METIASRGYRLVRSDSIQKKVLKRDEDIKDFVAEERKEHEAGRKHGIHEVVVRRRNDGGEDECGVSNSKKKVEHLPEQVLL